MISGWQHESGCDHPIHQNDPAPLYLNRDDVLTAVASYSVTGANPSQASNVSIALQIAY